jgi:hypothetical protein
MYSSLPQGAALKCRNFRPLDNGTLQLRDGFTALTMSAVTATAIHSPFAFTDSSGVDYILYFQGLVPKKYKVSDGTVSSVTVLGTAIASSSQWNGFFGNEHLYIQNGTDKKWFDGTSLRDNGIRAFTDAEIASIIIAEGVREHTTANLASVTLAGAAGTALSVSTKGGYLFYSPIYDTSEQELGPATLPIRSTTRLAIAAAGTSFVNVAVLPDLSAVNTNWVKLIARTDDGGSRAYFVTTTSTAGATISRSGSTITVTATAHGLASGNIVILSGFTDTDYNRVWCATNVVDVDHFTITMGSSQIAANYSASDSGGTVKKILAVANAATTATVNVATTSTAYVVNQLLGIAASSVGGAQPGYQFAASICNPDHGAHVGNFSNIASRMVNTTRCNFRITGLPSLSGSDTEWKIQLGRTGDGGVVPAPIIDTAGNFTYCGNTDTVITINQEDIDGDFELPSRNGVIPATCDKLALVGDYAYAADSISSDIFRSASIAGTNNGDLLGDPYQSWAPNDVDTFPTHKIPTCIAENDYELVVGTKNHTAVLSNLSGFQGWRGPWKVGMAGKKAFCHAGPYGFIFLTGNKQLVSFIDGKPVPISEEYDAALLNQISDSNLSAAELFYEQIPEKGIDRVVVKGLNSSNQPIQVYHDFKLRDGRSTLGQAYDSQFASASPLGSTHDYHLVETPNAAGRAAVFACADNGRIYELESGSTDSTTEFDSEDITVLNGGTNRLSIPFIEWIGDGRVTVSVGNTLSTSDDSTSQFYFETLVTESFPDGADDNHWRAQITNPEMKWKFLKFALTSHSADGSLALNTIPGCPVETYGRIRCIQPGIGNQRART